MNPFDPLQPDMDHYPNIIDKGTIVRETLAHTGTPIFLCDRDILTARYQELDQCLSKSWHQHIIGYSFKTNYQVARSGIFKETGAWVEVVSGREYRLALELGYPGRSIIFNGPLGFGGFAEGQGRRKATQINVPANVQVHTMATRAALLKHGLEALSGTRQDASLIMMNNLGV